MKLIGITGNIASGKTTISRIIAEHFNLPLINVDDFCKNYINTYPLKFVTILRTFKIDANLYNIHELLRQHFFKNRDLKIVIETHIGTAFWHHICTNAVFDSILIEHPVLFEKQDENRFDFIIGVDALETIRIDRMKLRGYSQETIYERIANQIPLSINKDSCNLIISTNDNPSKEKIINELSNSIEFKALIS